MNRHQQAASVAPARRKCITREERRWFVALSVAQGTIEAAIAHISVTIERLRLVNRQLTDAKLQLDRLCKKLAEPVVGDDGRTCRGSGKSTVTRRSSIRCQAWVGPSAPRNHKMLCSAETIMLCGVCVALPW
jgi:hypothetical protein